MKFQIRNTDRFKAFYNTVGPHLVLVEKSTGRERTIQGQESIEFIERVQNFRKDKDLWDAQDSADCDNFFNSECEDHFLEDNEDDFR